MGFAGERPELEALRELEEVLRRLEVELAAWRRRALSAEARVGDFMADGGGARLAELEARNEELAQRLESARTRVDEMLNRLTFLEEQRGNGGPER